MLSLGNVLFEKEFSRNFLILLGLREFTLETQELFTLTKSVLRM